MRFVILLFLMAIGCSGATYYVDPSGGNDSNDGLATNTAWQTLSRSTYNGGAVLSAGDTLYLLDGLYQGATNSIDLGDGKGNSGSVGNPITIRNYPGSAPIIAGMRSTDAVLGYATKIQGKHHYVFSGITWSNNYVSASITSCTNFILTNLFVTAMPDDATNNTYPDPMHYSNGAFMMVGSSQSNLVVNNVFGNYGVSFPRYYADGVSSNQWQAAGSPITGNTDVAAYGDYTWYNLFVGNTFYHFGHDCFGMPSGYNVIRSNLFYNDPWRATNAMQSSTYYNDGNPQVWPNLSGAWGGRCLKQGIGNNDFTLQFTNQNGVDARTVVEDNDMLYASFPADSKDATGLGIAGRCGIFRRNRVAFSMAAGIYFEHSGGYTRTDVLTNNPAFYHSGMALTDPTYLGNFYEGMATLCAVYNNVVYRNGTMYPLGVPTETTNNIKYPAFGVAMGSPVDINNYLVNNIIIANYPSDLDNTFAQPLTYYQSFSTNWIGDWGCGDPKFVSTNGFGFVYNPANLPDFHLLTNSPCIDSGGWLTTCTGSSNGAVLHVFNALYFSDGNHCVTGDTIQLQGETNTAIVLVNDWTNNVLYLDRSLTWTNGQGVALQYGGNAPDMGAFESAVSGPAPPTPPGTGGIQFSIGGRPIMSVTTTNL